ncbi:MAG TPA: peptidyl-prolyl cis-trans isomerase [Acidobacteriota bacterium]|nr:peptidyl-prolyl cis-trans isomerase [Acidobacteriota bacterium]
MAYIEKGRAKTLTKIILWAVVISFIAAIFVTWGAQRSELQMGSTTVLQVAGINITPDDMQFYGNFYRYIRDRVNFKFSRDLQALQYLSQLMNQGIELPKIDTGMLTWYISSLSIGNSLAGSMLQYGSGQVEEQMLQGVMQMIGDLILSEQAKKAGMRVNDKEIAAVLASIYIDPDGNFLGEEEVEQDLRYYRIADQKTMFMDSLRRHLLARHYAADLFAAVEPDLDKNILEAYKAQSISATVHFAKFQAADYLDQLDYSQDDLKIYLKDHTGEFVVADGIIFDVDAYKSYLRSQLTDEDIQAYYNANKEDFKEEERRDFRRILIELPEDASEEQVAQAQLQIDEIYRRLQRPGETFASEVILENQARDEIEDEILANAVFALQEVGKYNEEAVRTSKGLEIVQLVKIHEAGYQPLEDVREEILDDLADERAGDEARTKAEELRAEAESGDWEKLYEPDYVRFEPEAVAVEGESSIYSVEAGLEDRGTLSGIDELLATETGQITDLFPMSGNFAFFRVRASGDELIERFEKIRPAVRMRYTKIKSRELAEGKARDLAETAASVTDVDAFKVLVEEAGITPEERTNSRWGFFEFGQELTEELFSAETPKLIGPGGGPDTYYVALVTEVTPFDEEAFNRRKPELRLSMLLPWIQSQPVIEAQLSYLINTSDVRLNREILSRMFGGGPAS